MLTKNRIYIFFALFLPIIFAIALQYLPLTNTTGYEFSLILTLPFFLSGGLIKFSSQKSNFSWKTVTSVLTIPIIISLFSNIIYSDCPLSIDAFFYLVLSVPAFITGYFIAKIIETILAPLRFISFLIVFIALLFIALLEFYFRPQIYFYNVVFGYFPGTMYDENIRITLQLIIYRVISLGFVIGLAKILTSVRKQNKINVLFVASFLIIAWLWLLKPIFSFSTSNANIQSELNLELTTDNFTIFTDRKINYDTTSLKLLHEFYYKQVSDKLHLKEKVRITSYIFKNKEQKKRLFGSENADVAKPWLNQIYLDEQSFTTTLEHEIVHIIAGNFGNPPFDVAKNINPALIEGLAMAVENNFDDADIDYITFLAKSNDYDLKISELFDGFNFLGNLSSLSYLFSGSFMKYLIAEYGADKIKLIYQTADFDKVYGKTIDQLEDEFLVYLMSKNYDFNSAQAQLYFGRASLIEKVCPRLAARIEHNAWRLFREKEYEDALEKFQFVFSSVGTYSSLNGIILTNTQLKNYQVALSLAKENLTTFSNTSYFYNLILRVADLSVLTSDSITAKNSLDRLQKLNPSNYYYNETMIRTLLLNNSVQFYKAYLLAPSNDKYQILFEYLDSTEQFSSFIPKLIDLRMQLGLNDANFISQLKTLTFGKSREDVFAAYELSKYYYRIKDYKSALYYAETAVKKNIREEYLPVLEKQFNLVSWSIERTYN